MKTKTVEPGQIQPLVSFKDPCEWNPEIDDLAFEDNVHANAEWVIGSDGLFRLCDSCANLPRFKWFKKRTRIAS